MRIVRLSGKDIKELRAEAETAVAGTVEFAKNDRVEILDDTIIMLNGEPQFFRKVGRLIPTLKAVMKHGWLKTVTVDMPAIPHLVGGADIMRPGIKALDEFPKGALVAVVDENHHKPIAVGSALFSSQDIQQMQKGKVIKNLHYVGDAIWIGKPQ